MNMNKQVYKKPTMIVAELNAFGCYLEEGIDVLSPPKKVDGWGDTQVKSYGFDDSRDDIDW